MIIVLKILLFVCIIVKDIDYKVKITNFNVLFVIIVLLTLL